MLEVETSGYSESDTTDHGYDKRFKCTQPNCKASFSKNSKLIVHIRRHTGERPFTCEEEGCGKSYTNMSHLKRHKKAFHYKLNTEAVLCPYPGCGVELTNKWNLKKHQLRKHNPLRKFPFPCPDCEQGFLRKRKLQEHSYIHTGVPVFKCEVCQMNFTTYNEFTKHKRHHKMYTCECKKEFGLWSVLLAHKKECATQRAICDVCNKVLANKGTLAIHRKIHLNIDEKPLYECHYAECYRYYHHKRNLFHHINNFHLKETSDNLQVTCTHEGCDQLFKGMVYLRRHLKTQHGTTPKVNKLRRPRRDKGIRKKPMSSILTGEGLSEHEQSTSNKTSKRKRTKKESYVSEESTTEHDSPISKNHTNETITSIPNEENGHELDKVPSLTLSAEHITNPPKPPVARTGIDSDASLDEILQNCDATLKIIEETLTRNGKVNCGVESKELSQMKKLKNEMIQS